MGTGGKALPPPRLVEGATVQKKQVVEQQTFVVDAAAVRRHRTRGDPAHIGMMTAAGHKQRRLIAKACPRGKHRRDCRDVRQVGAAVVGVVGEHHIAIDQGAARTAGHRRQQAGHALAHRSQVHGNVGCIGHQAPPAIKQGTGVVEPFAHVERAGALLQLLAHLHGDRRKAVVIQLQQHRIHRASRLALLPVRAAHPPRGRRGLEQQGTIGQGLQLPAGLEHQGGGGIEHQRRPLQPLTTVKIGAPAQRHGLPGAARPQRRGDGQQGR